MECNLLPLWYGWKITHLVLNNNHSLTTCALQRLLFFFQLEDARTAIGFQAQFQELDPNPENILMEMIHGVRNIEYCPFWKLRQTLSLFTKLAMILVIMYVEIFRSDIINGSIIVCLTWYLPIFFTIRVRSLILEISLVEVKGKMSKL